MPKIVIAGATGFIGHRLTSCLAESEATVVVLTRQPDAIRTPRHPLISYVRWDGKNQGEWTRSVDGADAVIIQGTEGGGHTGFVSTMVLVPIVAERLKIPIIAAGGIGIQHC